MGVVEAHPWDADNGRPLVRPLGVLLHVLGEVGLLSVGLAAVLTDVGLEVLGLLVLRDVLEETRLVAEALVAGVALVRFVGLVAPRMALEVGKLGEGLVAARVAAFIRLVPRVGPDVLLEVGQLGELPLADLAPVGLDAEVDPRVLAQVRTIGERFTALIALIRLYLPHVQL